MPSWPTTMPRFPICEDDVLYPVRESTPPSGSLHLPTFGLPYLSEDSASMYSADSNYFQSATRASLEDEVNLSDEFEPDRRPQRQGTEPVESGGLSNTEKATEWDENSGSKSPSKYNVMPPVAPATKKTVAITSTRSRSGSVSLSPRSQTSTSTLAKASQLFTRKSSTKLRSKLTKEVQGLQRGASTTSDHESASTDHDETAENDVVDDNEVQASTERTLRKRTVQQTHPFKFDKHNWNAQKSGRAVTTKRLEEEVKQAAEGTERWENDRISKGSSTLKRKASTTQKQGANSKRRSTSFTSPEVDRHNSVFKPAKATFLVRLDSFPGAVAAISLEQCDHIDKLMDFITDSWEWRYNGASFSHAIASFSWLTEDFNVLLRAASETSFERVVTEVQRAPMWAEDGDCDIDVTVYVQ